MMDAGGRLTVPTLAAARRTLLLGSALHVWIVSASLLFWFARGASSAEGGDVFNPPDPDPTFVVSTSGMTDRGFDRNPGKAPICWITEGTTDAEVGEWNPSYPQSWNLSLTEHYYSSEVMLLRGCPSNFTLKVASADEPNGATEHDREGNLVSDERVFRVEGSISLEGLQQSLGMGSSVRFYYSGDESENGLGSNGTTLTPSLSLQLFACDVVANPGLCSPFSTDLGRSLYDANVPDKVESKPKVKPRGTGENKGGAHKPPPRKPGAFVASEMRVLQTEASNGLIEFSEELTLTFAKTGIFFVVAFVTFLMEEEEVIVTSDTEASTSVVYKLDGSALVQGRKFDHRRWRVRLVNETFERASYAVVGISCLLQLLLMYCVVKHREHNVMKLAQAEFLIAFLVASVIGSAATLLLNPKNDTTCRLYSPFVMIPIQLMFAIVIGRLLRIISIMEPLLLWANKSKGKGRRDIRSRVRATMPDWLIRASTDNSDGEWDGAESIRPPSDREKAERTGERISKIWNSLLGGSVRRQFSQRDLVIMIIGLTIPQVIAQILQGAIAPRHFRIQWNEDFNVPTGVYDCHTSVDNAGTLLLSWLPFALLSANFVGLVIVSYRSRRLPSLFNEAQSMFNSLFITVASIAISVVVFFGTNSPSVYYALQIAMVHSVTLNMPFRLILPKLLLVWSGEEVVVSKIVREHNAKMKGHSHGRGTFPTSFQSVRGNFVNFAKSMGRISTRHLDQVKEDPKSENEDGAVKTSSASTVGDANPGPVSEERPFHCEEEKEEGASDKTPSPAPKHVSFGLTLDDTADTAKESNTGKTRPSLMSDGITMRRPQTEEAEETTAEDPPRPPPRQQSSTRFTRIRQDAPPPQRVVSRMLQISELTHAMNNRLLSGLRVSREDWETVREQFIDLGELFSAVEFDWNDDDEDHEKENDEGQP